MLVSDIYGANGDQPSNTRYPCDDGDCSNWVGCGGVHITVHRIPGRAPLGAPQIVHDQNVSASGGSITVPFTFQGSHDAFAVCLTPASSSGGGFGVYGDSGSTGAAIDQWTRNGRPFILG
ncbi:hypothetical protein [Streptomyces rugosispiralis]|uniref:Uncharacterized protein n=1 Tax=Streptomyces rugosispiralis TaxID=2967341 RepID=A0ABT1VEK5_9ACTN|nr:hypothetical protein [Streptomyces rugosispiralis]MCQ8195225.1 hypothetical protein [Streptomyces rugosispiralis]